MKSSVAAATAAAVLVAVSILAIPAVASGADYLADAEVTASAAYLPTAGTNASTSDPADAAQRGGFTPLITAWGAGGALLLSGAAVAVGASVRRQRNSPADGG